VSKMVIYGQALFRGFPFKAFTRDIWLICLSNVIGAFGEGLYFYVFPLYIRALQADYVQIGLVFSALYGASALTLLLGGVLADRFDRKKILIMGWVDRKSVV
jgi:MFS family permease